MEDQQLRDLFSNKLANAEAPVDPTLWAKISSAPAVAGASATGAGASAVLAWVGVAVAAIAITSAAVFFTADTDANPEESTQRTEEQLIPVEKDSDETSISQENSAVSDPQNLEVKDKPKQAQTKRRTERIVGDDPAADTILLETVKEIPEQKPVSIDETVITEAEEIPVADNGDHDAPEAPTSELVADENLSANFSFFTDPYDELTIRFNPEFQEGAKYIWLFGDGTTSEQRSPEHSYEEEGSYEVMLTVVDVNGFTEKQNIEVDAFLPAQIVLPNVFTPNGDGRNDYLTIGEDSRKVNIERILVYDSNGTLVFEQLGEGPGWDGTDRSGNACERGNYRLIVVATSNAGQQFNESQMVRLQR